MAMLLLFSPILLTAFGLIIWAGVMLVSHARKGRPVGLKCLLAAFGGLVLLDIPVCVFIVLSAGLGHSTDASEVASIKCLLSFILVVVAPSAALLIYRYHGNRACARPDAPNKKTPKTGLMALVTALGLITVCIWLFAAAGAWPLLLYFARNRHDNAATFLMESGININATDRFGWTPLALYSARADMSAVRLLVDRGADVNLAGKKGAPLIWAALAGNEAVARLLLEKGAGANPSLNEHTPLMYAAWKGNPELVRLLVEHGAEVNRNCPQGSALIYAVTSKNLQTVVYLLENGANPDAKTVSNRTPLMQAAGDGSDELIKVLLEKGANPNLKSYDGQTALKLALAGGHTEAARLIEEHDSK
jgi:ankyrin repeat protein